MRVLGLDVGERRIGVAVSDPSGLLATPLTAVIRRLPGEDIDEVLCILAEQEATRIAVGLPLELSGRRGAQARRVSDFVTSLAERAPVPVETVDERYSTVEAERLLRGSGAAPSRDRARLDAAAAAVILQSYLDSERGSRSGGFDV